MELIKEKRNVDAFRRFSKAMKMLIAIEPINPEVIDAVRVKEIIDLKVNFRNNIVYLFYLRCLDKPFFKHVHIWQGCAFSIGNYQFTNK